jgi:hypothetical protein
VVVGLAASEPRWLEAIAPRYAPFRSKAAPRFELELVTHERRSAARAELLAMMSEPPAVAVREERLTMRSRSFAIDLDLARGGRVVGPCHRYPVDLALRALLVGALDDGLVLHGAFLADGNRGFVCAGPSGTGKSTLSTMVAPRALCDELTVVRRRPDGGWRAQALPYWHGRPGEAELERLFLLAHGPRHDRRPLAPAVAWRRLAREVLWPGFSAHRMARAFELCERLLAEVPVEELAFRPTPDVWDVVSRREVAA